MKYFICNLKNKMNKKQMDLFVKRLDNVDLKQDVIVMPSLLYLNMIDTNKYILGAQDISSIIDHTVTGEITGTQLKDAKVEYVLVGHFERRLYKNEINIDFINKINEANNNKLKVIYCIGESLKEHENGTLYEALDKQICEVLNNVELKNIIIAYEPTWSIGSNHFHTKEEIRDIVTFIKDVVEDNYNKSIEVIYGGSINPDNIENLNTIEELDGFLVGNSSLDVDNIKIMTDIINKDC